MTYRPIFDIANDISSNWEEPYFGAIPYLNAMKTLTTIQDMYYADSAYSVVAYFLSNAQTWRGEHARRIKKELNILLKS